jgi:thiol-disulfide isomerase/thioredoxin
MLLLAWLWLSLSAPASSAKVEVIGLEQFKAMTIDKSSDTLCVVNFWATWCKPCVAEMPFFEEAAKKFAGQKVKVVFVSLNYPREANAVSKFMSQKNIQSAAYLLDAGNPNEWIDKIETKWGGSIPATIMYKGGQKVFFHEGELTQNQLDSIIKTKIQ